MPDAMATTAPPCGTQTQAGSTAMQLVSTGVVWDIPRLWKRYRFLRALREDVFFFRLCYPYWLCTLTGSITWPVLGRRDTAQLRILDARETRGGRDVSGAGDGRDVSGVRPGTSQKLLSRPETVPETVLPNYARADLHKPFPPQRAEDRTLERCPVHVAQPLLSADDAGARAAGDGWRELQKCCNLPLGIRADIEVRTTRAELIWKPFWVMRSSSRAERVFVFDATTGMGGTAEYWNVISYLFDL